MEHGAEGRIKDQVEVEVKGKQQRAEGRGQRGRNQCRIKGTGDKGLKT